MTRRVRIFLPVLTVLLLCAAPAGAGIGWFVGMTAGESTFGDYELDDEASSKDDSDTGLAVFGGYQINPYFAVGGGFVDLGELNASGKKFGGFEDKLEADGIEAFAMGILPVSDRVSLFAHTGLFSWDQTVTYSDSFEDFKGDASGTDLLYGAGVNFDIFQEAGFNIHLVWTQYKKVGDLDETGHQNDIDLISFGFTYLFGK